MISTISTAQEAISIHPWLSEPPHPEAIHLFCFPFAGGSSRMYHPWSTHLPSNIQVCPLELPGRGQRFTHPPFRNLPTLIATLGPLLLPHLDQPFAFFGHSLGALISFELVRWLRRQQAPLPQYLFVSGRSAPQVPHLIPALHQLPDPDFIAGLRTYNGTPESVLNHPELMEVLLPTLRADFELFETYQYCHEAPLPCPIYTFAGQTDPLTSLPSVKAWQSQTSQFFEDYWFPGAHFFLQDYEQQVIHTCAEALSKDRQ